ncbi:glycosyltransferase family A protein [Coralloluteibacterium stylophorae]|uniref:glycosyltransferase family 2 protein n=1 Tax=Coralloluteibacterium stylophorae TaxID=1776034 RepID=UPI0030843ECC
MGAARGEDGGGLPVVVIPLDNALDALDDCLAALERTLPAGARVWLVDDAAAEPRVMALVERWLARTRLAADCTRRSRPCGPVRLLAEAMRACAGEDVLLLAADARPAGTWLPRMVAALAADPAVATVTPWCNVGELAAWPRIGEINPPPADLEALAAAAAGTAPVRPALPVAVAHAVLLRQSACAAAGGLDADSYGSLQAALADLCARLAGLGWRNVLADDAFVARSREAVPAPGDQAALAARWPGLTAAVARFLMDDPLRAPRAALEAALARRPPSGGQRDLFA